MSENQRVSREECERWITTSNTTESSFTVRLARAYMALLDECENLRKDKERRI